MEMKKEKRLPAIPDDLVTEILARLPAKSVVRFRSVSKQWCSMTSTPDFIKRFANHSSARPSLLCVVQEHGKRVFFSFPYQQDPRNRYTPVEEFHMTYPMGLYLSPGTGSRHDPTAAYTILNSINGLVHFNDRIIWNPSLRERVVLPFPETPDQVQVVSFLGYDPIGQKYKVLAIANGNPYKHKNLVRVLTLGAQEPWRVINLDNRLYRKIQMTSLPSSVRGNILRFRGGVCIHGVIYYHAAPSDFIVSFHVGSETFETIRKPDAASAPHVYTKDLAYALINYHGKLAWICTRTSSLWVLEDAQNHEWSSLSFVSPSFDGQSSRHYLVGVTDSCEVVYMPKRKKQPFSAFFYHLDTKRTRQVAYQGTKNKRSYSFDRGDKIMYRYDYFPTHFENLMSIKSLFP